MRTTFVAFREKDVSRTRTLTKNEAIKTVWIHHPEAVATRCPYSGMIHIIFDPANPKSMVYGNSGSVAETWIKLAHYILNGGF